MRKKIIIFLVTVLSFVCCLCLVACNDDNSVVSYKVEYVVNSETYHTGDIKDGVLTNMPQNPEVKDFVFDGWYLDNEVWKQPLTIQALLELPLSPNNSIKVYAKLIRYTCDLDNKSHTFKVVEEVKASCTSNGYKIEKCEECEYEKNTILYALQHTYVDEITTPAKCGVAGVHTYSCTRDNCDYSYTQPITALQHTYTDEITTPAKCEVAGVRTYSCTRDNCDYSYTQPITALQHTYSDEVTMQPTCTTEGVRTYTCTRTNCSHSYTEKISELQHSYDSVDTIKPCVRNGLRTHTCTRSNCDYSYTEVLPALSYHDCDKNGNCIRCNAENVCSKNFGIDNNDLLIYNGNEANVIIPSMFNGKVVTSLWNTFSNNQTLQTVYIPDTVEIIGMTFYCCINLKSVRMSENIKFIGSNTFSGNKITSIYIPKTVEMIFMAAFSVCPSLIDVYYEGSEDDWDKINIDGNNNALVSANITYNYIREE